jgi:hypothetical protein
MVDRWKLKLESGKNAFRELTITQKEPNEKELLEILELAREAERKAKEMCEPLSTHTKKWRLRAEAAAAAKSQR